MVLTIKEFKFKSRRLKRLTTFEVTGQMPADWGGDSLMGKARSLYV